jgi:phage baseplate assembly protein V
MSLGDAHIRAINKLLGPMGRSLRGMVLRGVITLVNDAAALQRIQLQMRGMPQADGGMGAERADNLELLGHYGLTSVPHAGAEAIMLSVNGTKAHGVVIAVDDRRYRLTGLQTGEVALYDDLGNQVKLGRDELAITGVSKVHVTAPTALIEADTVQLGGEGGQKVARVGDQVDLSTGLIKTGSDKVTAA